MDWRQVSAKTARTKQPSRNMVLTTNTSTGVSFGLKRGSESASLSGKVPVPAKNDGSLYLLRGGRCFVPDYDLVPVVSFEVTDLCYRATLLAHCSHVLLGEAAI